MQDLSNIVILTGAGVSAESGVPTFRAADGLWEGHRVEDVATPEAFVRDRALVQQFYDARRAWLDRVEPNAAHVALARLDAEWRGGLLIVTQNVDDLHERARAGAGAGAGRLLHMHGELKRGWCLACDQRFPWEGAMSPNTVRPERSRGILGEGVSTSLDTNGVGESELSALLDTDGNVCPACETPGMVRPDIVWFGELPYEMERIEAALLHADLFVSVGTSGAVYPAAGFVQTAKYRGARTLEINLEPSQGSVFFDERRFGLASEEVPRWVGEMLE